MRKKRRGNSGRRALLILALLALACVFLVRGVFVVRHVTVRGAVSVPQEDVVRAAGIQPDTSIFAVDEAAARRGVNALGTVAVEQIGIRYPNTVQITVRARERAAMALFMGKIRILDPEGVVMEATDEAPNMDLVYVSGLQPSAAEIGSPIGVREAQLEAYRAVISAIRQNGASGYVSQLDLDAPEAITLCTRRGITVLLGDVQNMGDKIAWMKSAVADLEQRGESGGTLDVSSAEKADYRPAQSGT